MPDPAPPETAPRTVIVGDIHGCFDELEALLAHVGLRPTDRLVTIGDAIVKGPKPREVLDLLLGRPNTTCLMGNMEWRLLEEADSTKRLARLPPAYAETLQRLGAKRWRDYREAIADWPLHLDLGDVLCVHAGVRPGLAIEEHAPEDLVSLRQVEAPRANGKASQHRPWWELYAGPRTVVFGHTVFAEPLVTRWAIGLDTGCVYGGHLSALVLPGREIVRVPAQRVHWPQPSKAFLQRRNPHLDGRVPNAAPRSE